MPFSDIHLMDDLLIPVLETLGYPLNVFEEGVCHGMVALTQNAMMMGQYNAFMTRLERMHQDNQAGWFEEAKAVIDSGELATFVDKEKLFDYLAFTDALVICQDPCQYSDLFAGYPRQRDAMDLPWLLPMRQAVATFSTRSKAMLLSFETLEAWLGLLEGAFKDSKLKKVSITLNNMDHVIHLAFDGENSQWILCDTNAKGFCKTIAFSRISVGVVASSIQKALWFDEEHEDVTKVSSSELTTLFSYDFTVLMDERHGLLESKRLLERNRAWSELHQPTVDKLDFMTDDEKGLLHMASCSDDDALLIAAKQLKGFDPNQEDADGVVPLAYAIRDKAEKAFSFLMSLDDIELMAISGKTGDTLLMIAAERNLEQFVAKLLAHPSAKMLVNAENVGTALHRAVAFGCVSVAKQIVDSGLLEDINRSNPSYLQTFCLSDHISVEMLAILLSLPNLNIDITDSNQVTPFWKLMTMGKYECADMLYQTGKVNINHQDFNQDSLLIHSIEQNLTAVFNHLTKHYLAQLNWNVADLNGNTAFHHLCEKRQFAMIVKLVRDGYIAPTLTNVEGKTGFDILFEQGSYQFCRQLFKRLPQARKPASIHDVLTPNNYHRLVALDQQGLTARGQAAKQEHDTKSDREDEPLPKMAKS